MVAAVTAALSFTRDTGEKPVSGSTEAGGRIRQISGSREDREVVIADGRALGETSLDVEGFRLISRSTRANLRDEDAVRASYYEECAALVSELTGASRVEVFDHTIRHGDVAEQAKRHLREPVRITHNDYTVWSGPQRVRDLFPDEAGQLLAGRVAIVQLWRPITSPLETDPLAICDARSLAPGDLIPAERRHADRVGEIYHLAYSEEQRWCWFPDMTRDEVLVFKCYDSLEDGRARFTAHGSFVNPQARPDAPPRESIEIRTLAFFS